MSRIGRVALGLLLTAGCVVAPVAGTPAASAAVEQYACEADYDPHPYNGGLTADIYVKNTGIQPVRGWTLSFPLSAGLEIIRVWNAELLVSKGQIATRNLKWNGDVDRGEMINIGFEAKGPVGPDPSSITVNALPCTLVEYPN